MHLYPQISLKARYIGINVLRHNCRICYVYAKHFFDEIILKLNAKALLNKRTFITNIFILYFF